MQTLCERSAAELQQYARIASLIDCFSKWKIKESLLSRWRISLVCSSYHFAPMELQRYLNIDIKAEPEAALRPVPKNHLKHLANFALWLFGSDKKPAVVKDSRQVDLFGQILESAKAIDYLERTERPSFDVAFQIAGGDEPEVVRLIERAADNIEAALSRAHRYSKSKRLRAAAERVGQDTFRLLSPISWAPRNAAYGAAVMLPRPAKEFQRSITAHNVDLAICCDWLEASVAFSDDGDRRRGHRRFSTRKRDLCGSGFCMGACA